MLKETVKYNFKNSDIKVYNLSFAKYNSYRAEHFHKEAELVLVLSGKIDVMIDDRHLSLSVGQSAYIGMNRIHRLSPAANDSRILILQSPFGKRLEDVSFIEDENLRTFVSERRTEPYALFLEEGNEFSEILYKIERELATKEPYYESYIKGYMQILVGFLSRHSIISAGISAERAAMIKKIEPIAAYISENYRERISLDTLSASVKYDKYYICKLMKNTLNITFTEYLSFVRLQNAVRLLCSGDVSVSDIIYETGFTTPQSFFKVFKGMYGYTPHRYKTLYSTVEMD